MTDKIRRPKVNLPGLYKDVSMMMAVRNGGKIDRGFIRTMCSAVHTYETRRVENLRKMNRDSSSDDQG